MAGERQDNHIDFIAFLVANADTLRATREFSQTVWGWRYHQWGQDSADTLGFGLANDLNRERSYQPASPLAVVYVRDLALAPQHIEAAGGRITRSVFAFPGGRRFHFSDPAGNELAVWSDA